MYDLVKATLLVRNNQQTTQLLEKARLAPGFCLHLLVIGDEKSAPFEIRQAALVTLKTTVDAHYSARDGAGQIPEDDKSSLKQNVIAGNHLATQRCTATWTRASWWPRSARWST